MGISCFTNFALYVLTATNPTGPDDKWDEETLIQRIYDLVRILTKIDQKQEEPEFFGGNESAGKLLPLPWQHCKGDIRGDVYNRPAYRKLFKVIMQNDRDYVVHGIPGIGKSVFFVYILWRFIHDSEWKVTEDKPEGVAKEMTDLIITSSEGSPPLKISHEGQSINVCVWDHIVGRGTFVVHDGEVDMVHKRLLNRVGFQGGKYTVLALPRKDNTRHLSHDYIEVVLPPWNWNEVSIMKESMYKEISDENFLRLFLTWGGVPRAVFQYPNTDEKVIRERAMKIDPGNLLTTKDDILAKDAGESFKVIHIWTDESFQAHIYGFASLLVREIVMERFEEQMWRSALVSMSVGDHDGAGKIYEGILHSVIPAFKATGAPQVKFAKRELVYKNNQWELQDKDELVFPLCKKMYFVDDYFDALKDGASRLQAYEAIYAIPVSPNYRTVDSVIVPKNPHGRVYFLQITLAPTHNLLMAGYMNVYNKLCECGFSCEDIVFYFVVPDSVAFYPEGPTYSSAQQEEEKLFANTKFGVLYTNWSKLNVTVAPAYDGGQSISGNRRRTLARIEV